MGYDSGSKQVINLSMDNQGGAFMGAGALTDDTASWSGDGYMAGQKVKVRESMTKVDPKKTTHKIEFDFGKGFQLAGEDICTK